jgi:hypothetical protein
MNAAFVRVLGDRGEETMVLDFHGRKSAASAYGEKEY